jgi:hypothetical protein
MIQWFSWVDSTPQSISERAKTKEHIKTFHRYFYSLSQQGSLLLGITSIEVVPWIWVLLDGPAWCIEEILAIKPICGNSSGCKFLRWRLNHQCEFSWNYTRTAQRAIINDWIYQIGYTSQRADIIWACNPYFRQNSSKSFAGGIKLKMHDPRLSCIYISKDSLLQCMHEAAAKHRTPSISPISLECKREHWFNFVEVLWCSRSWPRSQSERGKSNLEWKKNTFMLSNYNELVDILSSGMETPCAVLVCTRTLARRYKQVHDFKFAVSSLYRPVHWSRYKSVPNFLVLVQGGTLTSQYRIFRIGTSRYKTARIQVSTRFPV